MTVQNGKYGDFYEDGKKVEKMFLDDIVAALGGEAREASRSEDIVEHIDVYWNPLQEGKRECSFDVKGARKERRNGEMTWDSTWLELQNVHGERGSLYGSEDYIAFEGRDTWYVTRRKELLEQTLKSISDDTIYTDTPNGFFKKYQRAKWGRKDITVKVPMSFIEENSVMKISKRITD